MGQSKKLKTYSSPRRPVFPRLSAGVFRTRPRAYAEWRALRRWGKLPDWERPAPGYVLRGAREEAGLTQGELARLLGVSQQAIAQAERPIANPSIDFIRRWAIACGARVLLEITREGRS
jgi:DNA-binding XRE family transcriptional regulator